MFLEANVLILALEKLCRKVYRKLINAKWIDKVINEQVQKKKQRKTRFLDIITKRWAYETHRISSRYD